MTEEKTGVAEQDELDGAKMPFTAHLEELRRRLIICLIAVAIGFGVCYYYSKFLFGILMLPLLDVLPEGEQLVYTALPEAFFTYLKVGLWGGILMSLPVIFYELWGFIAPGLYKHEKGYVIPFVILSTALFLVGGFFGYFVVFPFGFKFFVGFADQNLRVLPAVKEYFTLAIKLLFGFGIIFELPLILVFLGKMGIVNARMLSKGRKWAVLVIFIVAAILTPPDVITQILMAIPLLVLYEISIILVRMTAKKRAEKLAESLGLEDESQSSS